MVKRLALLVVGALTMASVFATAAYAQVRQPWPDRGMFPATGTQIAILAAVVVVFLVGGILLWYFSHPRKRKDRDPSDGDSR